MKKNEVLDAMEFIDADIIDEADQYKIPKMRKKWIKCGAIAACLCIVFVGAFAVNNQFKSSNDKNYEIADANKEIEDDGIYIPPIELPNTADGVAMDMQGLVVYNGGIYTQSASYYGADALEINNDLIGKYLGYATGSIDEWSTQDEYAKEFASSIEGEVYEVIGYDTNFRICVKSEVEGENGETELFIQFLDRLNGITLKTGSDLFEDRLHLSDRIVSIQYISHEDWNNDVNNIQNANIDDALWSEFIETVDKGAFVYAWNPEITNSNSIYDTENQAHIILTLDDGTAVGLRLLEGGYVGMEGFGWYFVQIPGETFNAVFEACGGNS